LWEPEAGRGAGCCCCCSPAAASRRILFAGASLPREPERPVPEDRAQTPNAVRPLSERRSSALPVPASRADKFDTDYYVQEHRKV
jgi:hypothetical protein